MLIFLTKLGYLFIWLIVLLLIKFITLRTQYLRKKNLVQKMKLKAFELYSGIGGMHFGLLGSKINAEVVCAIDINTTANAVYRKNFPGTKLLERNIQSLTKEDFNNVNVLLMSPPCQPYSRNGLKKDKSDSRSASLMHLISLIPQLQSVKYILLENVKGFEESEVRDELLQMLQDSNYIYQEFLLSPNQFSIPNSRLRYYLVAKKTPLKFCFVSGDIMNSLPTLNSDVKLEIDKLNWKYKRLCQNDVSFPLGLILGENFGEVISDKTLLKYGRLFDIVTEKSTRSCCFTKGYSHFVEGTGSVISSQSLECISKVFSEVNELTDPNNSLKLLKSLGLRYFTPREISNLMCFPDTFSFPEGLSNKQKYRLLGNSINVHVVELLIRILIS